MKKKRKQAVSIAKTPEKESEQEKKRDLHTIGLIYDSWKKRFTSKTRTMDEFLPLLNELLATIQDRVKNKDNAYGAIWMIEEQIGRVHAFKTFFLNTIKVACQCKNATDEKDCDWEGVVRIGKKEYNEGTATIECPSCKKQIGCDDMTSALPPESGSPSSGRPQPA